MKKLMKRTIAWFVTIAMLSSFFCFSALASTSGVIVKAIVTNTNFEEIATAKVGDTVYVGVQLSNYIPIQGFSWRLNYNNEILECISDYEDDDGYFIEGMYCPRGVTSVLNADATNNRITVTGGSSSAIKAARLLENSCFIYCAFEVLAADNTIISFDTTAAGQYEWYMLDENDSSFTGSGFAAATVKTVKAGVNLDKTEVIVNGTNGGTVAATVIDSTGEDVTASSNLTVSPVDGGVSISGSTITVDAKAKAGTYAISDGTYTANLTVTRQAEAVASVTVSPASATVDRPLAGAAANEQTFTAIAYNQYGEAMEGQTVQWSATGGTINADGKLTVDNNVAAGQYTVTATVSGMSDTAAVMVQEEYNKFPTTVKFEGVDSDFVTVTAPKTGETVLTYTATVYDQYGDMMPAERNYSTKYVAGRNITVEVDDDQNPVVFTVTIPAGCGTRENTLGVEDTEITLYVKDIEFAFEKAYSVSEDRTYGKTWGKLITIGEITATLNGEPVEGTYSLNVDKDAVPVVGAYSETVDILFNGSGYTNVVVDTVTYVKVKEAELTNVTANVEEEIVYIVNDAQNLPAFAATTVDVSNVTVTYGEITGEGASYFDYNAANGTIKVKDGTTDEADGQTATIPVTISAPNHTSVERTITVVATKKNPVTVTFNNAPNQTYTTDGYKLGEQFAAASVPESTTTIVYSYNGQSYSYEELCDVSVTDAGTYTVTAYYENNSNKGSATATFTIDKAPVAEPAAVTGLVYNGSEQTGVVIADDALYELADGSSNKGTDAGEYTTTLSLKDTDNYKWVDDSNGEVTWSISPKSITATVETVSNVTYNGSEQKPAVTVKDGETVIASSEYTVSYSNNTNAGTATVTVTDNPNGNYTFDAVEQTFAIDKAPVTEPVANTGLVYNGAWQTGVEIADDDLYELADGSSNKGTNADDYTTDLVLNDPANYEWADGSDGVVTWSIAPKTVSEPTIEIDPDSFTYTGEAQTPNSVIVKDGETVIDVSEYTVSYSNNTNAGTATVTIADNANGNYTVNGSKSFDISKADQAALSIDCDSTVTYGKTLTLSTMGGTGDGAVTYAVTNGTGSATVNGNILTATQVGSVTVVATKAGTDNYNEISSTAFTITVNPYEITAGDLSDGTVAVTKTYDGTTAAGTVTGELAVAGLGDETLSLTVTAVGAYAEDSINVGADKTVTLTLGVLKDNTGLAANYKLADGLTAYSFAAAAITPADYTYTVADQQVKVGGGLDKLTYPASANGVNSEILGGTFGWYTDAACTAEATDAAVNGLAIGNTKELYWKFTPDSSYTNYDITPKTGSITVTIIEGDPQNASFADTELTKTYGDEAFTNALTVMSGESDITSAAAERTTYTSSDPSVAIVDADTGEVTVVAPGTTTITANVAKVEGEYAAGSASYTLTVEQKLLDFGLQDITITKVYDGTTDAATVAGEVTFTGEIAGDDVAITAVAGAYADKNVGAEKTVSVTLSLTGADVGKYKLPFTTVNYTTASITASDAVTEATAKNQNVVVGVGAFAAPAFTGIGGETVNGTLNYSYDGATDKAAIEAKLAALTKGATAEISYTFAASGNYDKTVTGTITVIMVDILFFVDGQPATVDNAVTIKENPTYGDNWLQIVTRKTITASVNGKPVNGEYTLEQSGKPASGEQTFRILFNDGDRYNNVVVVEGTVTVAKKAAEVPTAVTGLVYTGGFHSGVNFDNLMVRVQQDSVSSRQDNAGTFRTTLELIDPANTYWIDRDANAADASSPREVEWSIAPKAVTVTPDAGQSKIYGETDPDLTYTTDLTDAALNAAFAQAVSGTLSRVEGKNVGEYAIEMGSLSAGGNFALTLSGTVKFAIEKKDVIISGVSAEDKTYDGSIAATADISAAVIDGKVEGDDLSVAGGTAEFASKDATEDITVTFSGFGLTGSDAGNYNLTAQPAAVTADIAAKEVAVVWTNTTLTYNGSAQAPTAAVTDGIVAGDSVPLNVTGQQTNVGGYNAAVTTTNGNYTLTNESTGFTIGKASSPSLGVDGVTTYKYTIAGEKYVVITGIPADAGTVSYGVGNVSGQTSALEGAPTAADGKINFTLAADAEDADKTVSIPVTVTMGNYEDANVTAVITIVEKDVPVLTADNVTVDYTGTALTSDAIIGTAKFDGADVVGTWSWVTDMNTLTNAGTYTATVRFTPEDSINYAEVTKDVTITVNKVKVVVPSAVAGLTYNTSEQTGVVDGEYYSVTGNTGTNAGDYTATVTLDDSANYEWTSVFEGAIQWSIAKATPTGTPNFTKINSSDKTLADVVVELSGMIPSNGTFKWVDAEGNELENTVKVEANKAYKWVYTPTDTANYEAASNSVVLYQYYIYVPSTPSTPSISTDVTENEDGSTTTTVTNNKTGTVTETTENVDGSTTVVETKKDGAVTETNTTADGVTGTTVTDAEGKVTEVTAEIPVKAAEIKKTVIVPVKVFAAASTAEAVEVIVTIPDAVENVTVEIPVADIAPSTVVVIVNEDGTEEVVKKAEQTENGVVVTLEGSATVKIVDNSKSFTDVDPEDWYADGVDFVSSRELYNGIGNDLFDPNGNMTRGMLVTVLHRMEDELEHNYSGSYSDVEEGLWYTDAVHWASEHKIVEGYGNGVYSPHDNITREQMVTMVFRYLNWLGLDTSARGDLSIFVDHEEISDWAKEAMEWGVGVGIINGIGDNFVSPKNNATRAQVAVFLQRVISLMV